VSVVCCQVEVSASGWSLIQRILPNVVCLSVIVKPLQWGGRGPLGSVMPWEEKKKSTEIWQLLFESVRYLT
jgi:hypothetical protein